MGSNRGSEGSSHDTPMDFPVFEETKPMNLADVLAERFEWTTEDFYRA